MPADTLLMKALTWLSGTAPMKPSAGWPLTKAITAGIDWIPIWPGIAGCSSMFIFNRLTLLFAARTVSSSIVVSWLNGQYYDSHMMVLLGSNIDYTMKM